MTEREITEQRIIFLKDRQTLFIQETDFKIGILKDKLRKLATAYSFGKPIDCCSANHTGDITGAESPFEVQRQKPRATNFDYKNEVEAGDIAPGIV